MIRRPKIAEINEIMAITRACARDMSSRGIEQWNEHYPSRTAFEYDLEMEELFVIEQDQKIIGSVTLSFTKDEEYKPIEWLGPDTKHLYVHRLCVDPEQQGKGVARQLMDFAENYGKRQGCASVRLDTFSQNPRNIRFYKARGYQQRADVFFPKQSTHPFHCFELLL